MKTIETKKELDFIKSIEEWKWISLKWSKLDDMKNILKSASKNTTKKLSRRKPINIRLLEDDIGRLKAMALNEWIPYQTYISKVIHGYTTGKIKQL